MFPSFLGFTTTNYCPSIEQTVPFSATEDSSSKYAKMVNDSLLEYFSNKYTNLSAQEINLMQEIGEERFFALTIEQRNILIDVFGSINIGKIDDPEYLLKSARENLLNA